ncbi:MBL fold metallo-hydrolase [Marinoscillum furvescens]|uniref:Glyoxylase-like metal-dependent hydrolase (Beta-lactamase superfamily II) n=1 Tax=Marinoscillum furvescens DSM 4134 TaxID=1122208 RepID=A0A3D9L3C6_MARFU|nr:MBL fold metallo-hydrolase [Marinoscillum furvescens]RED99743.1 glyoxylase-like metal-dependent hydrolase (beta-lactamase superfamily II) [Marinoscillum furvescens DSM 4134]
MEIKTLVFNPFYENTYILFDETKEAVIVDPGCYEDYERKELIAQIEQNDLNVKLIVNTHCHIDHVLGNYYMKEHFGCPLWIPEGEAEIFRAVTVYAPQWGITQYTEAQPDKLMKEGEPIRFGNTVLNTICVPGHSPGHFVFHLPEEQTLIGGDVLFKESIGRTDLPGGDHDQLLQNIKSKVYTLPDDTTVYPGHGPHTTVGHEKLHNPFVKG